MEAVFSITTKRGKWHPSYPGPTSTKDAFGQSWSQLYSVTKIWVSEWVKGAQSCLTLCDPMDYTVHGILQARILEWVAFPFSKGSSQPRDQIALQADYHLSHKKPKNTGVGSLSLLQQIFPTQELNRGLLCCRQILYQLSYQRSPSKSCSLTTTLPD